MPWPAAEVRIDADLIRQLLAAQHPDLAERPLVLVNAGFDNELWRLGDDLAVRIPRREVAADLVAKEQRWLPALARQLPLPIPAPVRVGRASGLYPWPWSVVPWLAGDPGDEVPVTDGRDAGQRLGRFLTALHRPAPRSAPFNPWRSVPLSDRADAFAARLEVVDGAASARRLGQIWQRALDAAPHSGPPAWIHGDLHPANTLTGAGTLVGVIDFGDLCAGDPATDLAAVWLLLPADGVAAFAAAYGEFTPAVESRSLGWATLFTLMLLELGTHDRPTYERMARAALERILARPSPETSG